MERYLIRGVIDWQVRGGEIPVVESCSDVLIGPRLRNTLYASMPTFTSALVIISVWRPDKSHTSGMMMLHSKLTTLLILSSYHSQNSSV